MAQQLNWTPINPDFSNSNRLRESASRTISEVGDTFGRISDSLNKRIEEENRQKQLEFTNAMEQQRFGLLQEADRRANDQLLIDKAKYENEVAEQQRKLGLEQAKDSASILLDKLKADSLDNKTGTYNMVVFNKGLEEHLNKMTQEEKAAFAEMYNSDDLLKFNAEADLARKQETRAATLYAKQMQGLATAQEQAELEKTIANERMYAYNVAKAQGLNETATLNFVNDHIRRKFGVNDPNISKTALENELKLYENATTLSDSSYKSLADFAKDYGIPTENRQALYASYELAKTLTGKPKMTESQYLNVMLPKMAYKDPLIGSPRVKGIKEEDIIDAFGLAPKGEPKKGDKVKLEELPTLGLPPNTGSTPSVPTGLTYTPTATQARASAYTQLGDISAKQSKDVEQARIKKEQERQKELESANKVLSDYSDKVNFDLLDENPSSKDVVSFRVGIRRNSNLTSEEKNRILKAIKTKYQ